MHRPIQLNRRQVKSVDEYEIINVQMVATLFGLSEATVRKLAKDGEIPCRKAGRKFLFSRKSLLEWIDKDSQKNA